MDRAAVLNTLPQNANELEDGELRVAVLNLIEKTAREIQTEGREPDQWEGPHLVLALDYLQQQGWANAALRVVQRALAEPGDRGAIAHHPPSEIPPATRMILRGVDALRDRAKRSRVGGNG